jgi:hypothetical protein
MQRGLKFSNESQLKNDGQTRPEVRNLFTPAAVEFNFEERFFSVLR